jgi:hypothetical protein
MKATGEPDRNTFRAVFVPTAVGMPGGTPVRRML